MRSSLRAKLRRPWLLIGLLQQTLISVFIAFGLLSFIVHERKEWYGFFGEMVGFLPAPAAAELTQQERLIVAYHEAGHVIAAWYDPNAPEVLGVVANWKHESEMLGQTAGKMTALPTRVQLLGSIAFALGGRAAEEVVFGQVTAGSAQDLEDATSTAYRMAAEYGMGTTLRVRRYDPDLGMSAMTESLLESDIDWVLESGYGAASAAIEAHLPQLRAVAEALLKKDRLDRAELKALLGERPPSPKLKPAF